MTEAEQFYLERDNRTVFYLQGKAINQIPIHVILDRTAASSAAGQVAVLALANQLSRVHRNITFVLPDLAVPLQVPAILPAATLAATILGIVHNIDPYGSFDVQTTLPKGGVISLGIGESVPRGLSCYIGATGAAATIDRSPCSLGISKSATQRGAALASCLGAAALFRLALGLTFSPRTLSCWNYKEGTAADPGPPDLRFVDVGNTLVVGAGAVGAAVIYWLHLFGVKGNWVLVDADKVSLNNTNRQLIYFPSNAGWKSGLASYKVDVAAQFLSNCQPYHQWYHDCDAIKNIKFDVILALANEHEVRTRLAQRNPSIMLHATTGENWLSELHRHVLGVDDCIRCRMNDVKAPKLACSTTALPSDTGGNGPDAALPFLSAASGLMLATALQKLQNGDLHQGLHNNWRWYFDSAHKMSSAGQCRCCEGCNVVLPPPLRRNLNKTSRWVHLVR